MHYQFTVGSTGYSSQSLGDVIHRYCDFSHCSHFDKRRKCLYLTLPEGNSQFSAEPVKWKGQSNSHVKQHGIFSQLQLSVESNSSFFTSFHDWLKTRAIFSSNQQRIKTNPAKFELNNTQSCKQVIFSLEFENILL